jgi:hypothetical protein
MDEIRGQWLSLTGATNTEIYEGRYFNHYRRFSDSLELTHDNKIIIEDCTIRPIGGVKVKMVPPARIAINRSRLVFAFPSNEIWSGPLREELVPKTPYPLAFISSGWIINGFLHIPEGLSPDNVLEQTGKVFVPITSAVAVFARSRSTEYRSQIMVLNMGLVNAVWQDGQSPQIAGAVEAMRQ